MNAAVGAAALALTCLAGCAPGPDTCGMLLATTVPLQLVQNNTKLAVPATIDQTTLLLFVDTGSERTVLDESAISVGELTNRFAVLNGIGGSRGGAVASVERLQIGRLHGAVPAVTASLGPAFRNHGFSGVLGMDILGAYDVDLDLQGGEMRLFQSEGACRAPRAVIGGPLYAIPELPALGDDRRPQFNVEIGGQTFTGMLDTGAPGVLLSGRAARQLGLNDASMVADRMVQIGGVGKRRVAGRLHVIDSLGLGDLTVHRVPAVVVQENYDPRVDVILGMDFVRRVHVWISNSSHALVVQVPPTPSPSSSQSLAAR